MKEDDRGRELKEFKVGEWYINPQLGRNSPSRKYWRVGKVEQKHSPFGPKPYHYNSFEFDAYADEDWNITYETITQANTDFDQGMVLVKFNGEKQLNYEIY